MKNICLFIMLICFISCKTKSVIVGSYLSKHDEFIGAELELRTDSTFVYNLVGDLINQYSEGIWKYSSKNKILLNSYKSYKSGIVLQSTEDYKKSRGIYIKVIDDLENPFSYGVITLNHNSESYFNLNKNGEVTISIQQSIKSIQVYYLGEKYDYNVIDNKTNFIELKIIINDLSKVYFQDKILKIKGSKLISNNLKFHKNK